MRRFVIAGVLLVAAASGLPAPAAGQHPRLEGDWEAKTSQGLRHVMVRADSSAQFGTEVARWRLVGDSLWITLGDGVWNVYGMRLTSEVLTLSGGDLDKPVSLRRVGPATARPDSLKIPPAPPDTARAWD